MLQSTCLISVGVLVDATVDRITSDILAIRDITADDSEKLNKLCGEIKGLEELFSQMTVSILVVAQVIELLLPLRLELTPAMLIRREQTSSHSCQAGSNSATFRSF